MPRCFAVAIAFVLACTSTSTAQVRRPPRSEIALVRGELRKVDTDNNRVAILKPNAPAVTWYKLAREFDLFVNGKKSDYYKEGDDVLIKKIFPLAQITSLDTGHWVQAEKPQEFSQAVLQFLK